MTIKDRPPNAIKDRPPNADSLCGLLAVIVEMAIEHGWLLTRTDVSDKGGHRHQASLQRSSWELTLRAERRGPLGIDRHADWSFVWAGLHPVSQNDPEPDPRGYLPFLVEPCWEDLADVHAIVTGTVSDLEDFYASTEPT